MATLNVDSPTPHVGKYLYNGRPLYFDSAAARDRFDAELESKATPEQLALWKSGRADERADSDGRVYRADSETAIAANAARGILPPNIIHPMYRVVLDGKTYEFKDGIDFGYWAKFNMPEQHRGTFNSHDPRWVVHVEDARDQMIKDQAELCDPNRARAQPGDRRSAQERMVERNAGLAQTPSLSRATADRSDERPGEDARERFLRRARDAHKRPGGE